MNALRLLPLTAALAAASAGPAHATGLLELYESARAYDAAWQSAKAQYDANLFRAEQAKAGGSSQSEGEVRGVLRLGGSRRDG